jgi:hypothetical protein
MIEYEIRNIQLITDGQAQTAEYRIEYVIPGGFTGRFLTTKEEIDKFGLPELVNKNIEMAKEPLDLLKELKAEYEGKKLSL